MSAAVALAIGACKPMVDYRGNNPDTDKVATIKAGQSTKVQVTRVLGSPTTISPLDQQTWYYISSREETVAFLKPRVREQKIVEISFDSAGVVTGIKRYSLKDAKKVRYVARTTPTQVGEPSMLRSLYDLLITGPINRGSVTTAPSGP
jgi:outer membrane protein assembly factor BamE (lipoprotein component of BamABCDE complex)